MKDRKPRYPHTSLKKYLDFIQKAKGRELTEQELVDYEKFYDFAQDTEVTA
jgi:hypothetical protein